MTWCMGTRTSLFIQWMPQNSLRLCLASGGSMSEYRPWDFSVCRFSSFLAVSRQVTSTLLYLTIGLTGIHAISSSSFTSFCCLSTGHVVIITIHRMLHSRFCHFSNGYIVTCHSSSAYIVISAVFRMAVLLSALRRMVTLPPAFVECLYCICCIVCLTSLCGPRWCRCWTTLCSCKVQ